VLVALWTILRPAQVLDVMTIVVAVVAVVVVLAVLADLAVLVVVDVVHAVKVVDTPDLVRLHPVEVSNLCWLLSASNIDACIVDTDEELPPVVHALTLANLDFRRLNPAG
jgi:hypothetical protein